MIKLNSLLMFNEQKLKALEITEALYRTTDLFSDAEPLKWALRKEALDILSVNPQEMARLEAAVQSILLKLELAASGTFISKINFNVLEREYKNLLLLDKIISDTAVSSNNVSDTRIGNRKETILSALKEKGSSGVSDIAKALGESVSEKTVQRELSSLVASGAVKQQGEKRWRKYFI